ncbi:CRISPR/Cas system-associated exonuclease Cas4, RecB family [Halogranum rubrum]|uniref:CRISPR/Cas system-associated exonuclease Cas4, RecB family n=1 Tax=Halogranum rubrum TaxID=553466 RepID=A0A1I4FX50_9EURY|nr:PD-(D/E)XK nuclease family protein [Halogranum rubrum]SFL21577.1 CRISPR/Cas system-associated exonuclease Cas4, RecB family [Halogranum rubrum]
MEPTAATLVPKIGKESFTQWQQHREIRQNIKSGKTWFNLPPPEKPPERHSPHQLNQCHRKVYYQQLNAPEESRDPSGIFWTGTQFEEEWMMPYLEHIANESGAYIRNSMWVDYTVDTDVGPIHIRGMTDPVIVDEDSRPILLTEIKTKQSVKYATEPSDHHVAQAYAYLRGLSEEWEVDLRDAVLIYGDRTTLEIQVFHIEFDLDRWQDLVVAWATNHTVFRMNRELPPADPEFGWECKFCSFKHRCGRAKDSKFSDVDAYGFLPLFNEYPEAKVIEYLDSHDGAKLTPTLASRYPDLIDQYEVYEWACQRCSAIYSFGVIEWDGNTESLPLCPGCANEAIPVPLAEPGPEAQRILDEDAQ